MQKQLICSGTKWEDIVGYSRAVRVDNTVEVVPSTKFQIPKPKKSTVILNLIQNLLGARERF